MAEIIAEISAQQTASKFAGEQFDGGNVRTVFAGASKVVKPKVGLNQLEKMILGSRMLIENKIFDQSSTPTKSITKYVFNATAMPFRPIIIDTPEITSDSEISTKEETVRVIQDFILESKHIHINALCLVLKFDEESISKDEEIISETISLFPHYMLPSTIILFSSNDEKPALPPPIKSVLSNLNLDYNKYYFFNDHFLLNEGDKQDDEIEKQKAKLSWDLSMGEFDRFFEQVRSLNPRKINPIEDTKLVDDDMLQHTSSTLIEPSARDVPHERIIPIKLIDQKSTTLKTSAALRDWDSSETPVIKRYFYDPGTMTDKEYETKLQKDRRLSAGEYANVQNFDTPMGYFTIPIRRAHETLINDVPLENRGQLSSDGNGITYLHMRSTPPPEYSGEAMALLRQTSDNDEARKTKIEKRQSAVIDIESQQRAHSQYPKSAVLRQIARRTSSGSEQSRSCGMSPQQQQSPRRQIRQTGQVIQRASERLNNQEHRNYVKTPEMKRSKSPILQRLLRSKKKQRPSRSLTDIREQFDNSIEQPRALESYAGQSLQSPLRSYGRLVQDDEIEEQPQDGTIYLSEESATTTVNSGQKLRTGKAGIGMKPGYGVNEHVILEEGLTPHPYKTDPWAKNGKRSKVGAQKVRSMEVRKRRNSTWDWVNCCFYLLAPLFIFFVIIAVIITLALLA